MEDQIQLLEKELEAYKAVNKEYKTTVQFAKEAALHANTRANKVAWTAAKVCSFVENTGEVVVAANLFKEGL